MPGYLRLSLSTFALALIAACSSTPMDSSANRAAPSPSSSTAPAAPATTSPPAAAASAPSSQVATVTLPAHMDPKNALSTERRVYFDFDRFDIRPEYFALVERHGRYLAGQADIRIKVEGHADERGSSEYNLALGQKRAQALVNALKLHGAREAQMEPVSWGEERPMDPGHDEAAWAKNRRADVNYLTR